VLAVRRSSEEIARERFVDTQRRLDNGLASPLEVLQAEVNWRITQPETSQAQRNLNVALQNLKNFAGLAQSDAVVLEGTLNEYPAPPSFETAFDERAGRPDYQALLSERRLREINVAAQRAQFYPTLSAQFAYGWQASDDGFDLGDPTDSFSAGLVLTVPIFFGGSRFSLVEEARLELRQVDTRIAIADENIATEIETIRLVLEEAAVRIESALQTLATAERAYEVTETSLTNGLATQLDLEDARVNLEQARLNHLAAVFDYLSAYFDWQLATGRGDEGL
ncbi:MAG: TolC family protein, partial [Spirochaetales bacterium]|nr:TolC family protein [Spirochaetales bacterium]